ncbi:MAG: SUMF1/EgtB/PvdO family nonheme iron enzyme [Cyanobacteria bacterium RI_101]|nr:SUMF1/EgtB/PvdO family nonheme iron enzyme [Cyanobacteria bacterium RI_101]
MVAYRSRRDGQWITLTQELAHSGEAKVWRVDRPGFLAKIYHDPHNERVQKLEAMVLNAPSDPNAHQGHISFAWPDAILEESGGDVVGFLMPEVTGGEELIKLCTFKARQLHKIPTNWYFLHVTARNIAGIIQAIHDKGYVLGDIKLQNILVNNRALPTIIDTDSFQVRDLQAGRVFRCLVGSEGFTPPELLGADFAQVTQTEIHDRFRLGVVVYYLLFGGPPFRGIWRGAGDPPEVAELIRRGYWPFGVNSPLQPSQTTIPLDVLHPDLSALFLRCFNEGHGNPLRRPTAREWASVLDRAFRILAPCQTVDSHFYFPSSGYCYWCERIKKISIDIFPGNPVKIQTTEPVKTPSKKSKILRLFWNGTKWEKVEDKAKVIETFPKNLSSVSAKKTPIQKAFNKVNKVPPQASPTIHKTTQNSSKVTSNYLEQLPNGTELEMVPIPAGWFLIMPQKKVTLKKFYMGKYLVTHGQWQAIMGNNQFYFDINAQNPVERVSWNDCQIFCKKLSALTGKIYRLPSETEWEYACRSGTTTRYFFGNNMEQLVNYAWYGRNSGRKTHSVGQKKPNLWGLYDMHGNLWEWCEDSWHGTYNGSPTDGSAWVDNQCQSDLRVLRGGAWSSHPTNCHSSSRHYDSLYHTSRMYGFRLVLEF